MKQKIEIEGMHCGSCVTKVKNSLESDDQIDRAQVNLEKNTAELVVRKSVENEKLQALLKQAGDYRVVEKNSEIQAIESNEEKSFLETYKPLLLIVSMLLGVSVLVQYPFSDFNAMLMMRHFMAGFFIVFSFFKLLNIKGFATSYAMYDLVAAKWKGWGYVYPFVELLLGISYLINLYPTYTNVATILILGVSSIGVVESNLNKRRIKCACLGDVFNLPMSTVTVVEDLSMVAMAAIMLTV